jgi:hypothetical protein
MTSSAQMPLRLLGGDERLAQPRWHPPLRPAPQVEPQRAVDPMDVPAQPCGPVQRSYQRSNRPIAIGRGVPSWFFAPWHLKASWRITTTRL